MKTLDNPFSKPYSVTSDAVNDEFIYITTKEFPILRINKKIIKRCMKGSRLHSEYHSVE